MSDKKNHKATARHYQKLAKQAKKAKGNGIISKIVRKITGQDK